jgi:hypothetical protein
LGAIVPPKPWRHSPGVETRIRQFARSSAVRLLSGRKIPLSKHLRSTKSSRAAFLGSFASPLRTFIRAPQTGPGATARGPKESYKPQRTKRLGTAWALSVSLKTGQNRPGFYPPPSYLYIGGKNSLETPAIPARWGARQSGSKSLSPLVNGKAY